MNKKHSHTNYGHLLLGTITRGGEDPTTLRRYQSILVQLIITTLSFIKYKFLIYYLHVGSLQIIDLGPICMEKTCLGRRVTFLSKLPWGTKLFLHFHFYLQGKPFMRNTKLVWPKKGDPAYCKARSPFSDCRVNLPAGPTFLNINVTQKIKLVFRLILIYPVDS